MTTSLCWRAFILGVLLLQVGIDHGAGSGLFLQNASEYFTGVMGGMFAPPTVLTITSFVPVFFVCEVRFISLPAKKKRNTCVNI